MSTVFFTDQQHTSVSHSSSRMIRRLTGSYHVCSVLANGIRLSSLLLNPSLP